MNVQIEPIDGTTLMGRQGKCIFWACALVISLGCFAGVSQTAAQSSVVTVEVGSTNVSSGQSFDIPVFMDGGTNVLALYLLDICYDTNVLMLANVLPGTNEFETFDFNPNFAVSTNCMSAGLNASVRILGINADTLVSPTGLVLAVELSFVATGSPGSSSPLMLSYAEVLNPGPPPADPVMLPTMLLDGLVQITGDDDGDADGVSDSVDGCPDTPAGEIVDSAGCSIAQLVPCSGPASGGTWKNHGAYVSAVAKKAEEFLSAGLITASQKDAIVSQAAESNCGK